MSQALESIQEKIKAELANVNKSVAPPASRNISTAGKVFTLPDGTSNPGPMHCVILDHRNFNRYYTRAYDPQNPAPPDCFAIAKEIDALAPHEDAQDPQSDACATCPNNAWGSAATGKGKACRNSVRLAIASTDATTDTEPMILTLPPTALKGWNSFVNNLSTAGLLPIQVNVEISFDKSSAFPLPVLKAEEAHDKLKTYWQLREKAQTVLDQPPVAA